MAKIQPIVFPIKGTATELELRVNGFSMQAKSAIFHYRLIDNRNPELMGVNKLIDEGNLSMTESEFENWGADNNYCIEWAAYKLGLTLIP
jgi:hypothetical protein